MQATRSSRIARRFFLVISSVQFHPLFWAGRTTPNGLALPIVITGLALVFARSAKAEVPWRTRLAGLALLTVSAVISRLEIAGIVAPAAVWIALIRQGAPPPTASQSKQAAIPSSGGLLASAVNVSITGLLAGIIALLVSVPIDTYFWDRPWRIWNPLTSSGHSNGQGIAWPELEAILFNVVEGKSAEWGVSPWHGYLTQHLPKLLSIPVVIFAAIGTATAAMNTHRTAAPLQGMAAVCCAHIALLSRLGHKETRFISYLAPLINIAASIGAARLWQYRGDRTFGKASNLLARLVVLALVAVIATLTAVSLIASAGNYPGGEAMARLHALRGQQNATVHIDVLPAMTGVSLFQSVLHNARTPPGAFGLASLPSVLGREPRTDRRPDWVYDKTENLFDKDAAQRQPFDPPVDSVTHILSDDPHCHRPDLFVPMRNASDGTPYVFAEFAGIQVLKRTYATRLRQLLSRFMGGHLGRGDLLLFLPLEFKWREAVWLCEKKGDAL